MNPPVWLLGMAVCFEDSPHVTVWVLDLGDFSRTLLRTLYPLTLVALPGHASMDGYKYEGLGNALCTESTFETFSRTTKSYLVNSTPNYLHYYDHEQEHPRM